MVHIKFSDNINFKLSINLAAVAKEELFYRGYLSYLLKNIATIESEVSPTTLTPCVIDEKKKKFFSLNHVIVYSPFCRHHIRNVFCCRKTFLCASSFSLFLTHIVRIHYCDITLHYLGLNNALFSLRIQCEFKRYVLITLFINFTPSA